MSAKEVKAVVKLLVDTSFDDETDETLAEAIIDKIDELRAEAEEADIKKKYLVVVGQTLFRGQTKPATVALGPFGARAGTSASREGGKLSYDVVSHRMGRYMVVPLFKSAFEANKNFVADVDEDEEETEPLVSAMAEATWHLSDQPACQCGLRYATHCYRHNKELS